MESQELFFCTQSEEQEEIARIAYFHWEARGREAGHDVEDWLAAEREVTRRRMMRPNASEERPRRASTAA